MQPPFPELMSAAEVQRERRTSERCSAAQEAAEALVALGYSAGEAERAVSKVELTDDMTADDVLKQSLRHLAF